MDSRLRTSRLIFRTTSTSSGIGCPQGATFLRRCGEWIFRKRMAVRARWAFQLSLTESPRKLPVATWSHVWSRCSMPTPMATGPGKSAIDAVRQARQRCWRYDWVLDLDVKGYFDSIDWELLLRAVRHHTNCPWALLYIERWLKV